MKSQNRLPFYLTLKYLQRGKKWTLFLTVFLVAIAFVNLLFISSLFNGIIKGTNEQIINTMTGNIYIAPKEGEEFISNKTKNVNTLRSIDGVIGVSAQAQLPARLEYKKISGNWQVLAIKPGDEAQVTNTSQKMIAGRYLEENDEDGIILGQQIAGGDGVEQNAFSLKGAKVGEKVKLIFNNQSYEFTIRGIFKTKFLNADEQAFITQKAFEKLLPEIDDKTSTIIIKVANNHDEDTVISSIKDKNIDGNVYTWREVAGLMKSVSESFSSINVIMTFVGILIAAVTIFIVIYVDIINKRKQIGILRAIGIRPYIIIFSYVILSAVYSVIGVLLGTAIFFAILTPYFIAHPFQIPITDVVLALDKVDFIARAEAVMWVSVFSGLIPAAVVTRTKMLDAILGR
ncbi:MAG: ABC transporter permease [Patescibacteria group bacterium]